MGILLGATITSTTIFSWFAIAAVICDCLEHRPDKSRFYREGGSFTSSVAVSSISSSQRIHDGHDINEGIQEKFFEQRLDHFSDSWNARGKTFQQRYFYSERYVTTGSVDGISVRGGGSTDQQQDERPTFVFLCVGGEGPSLDFTVLIDSVHCTGDMIELAKRLYFEEKASIYMYAIEHRYYGKSVPKMSTAAVDNVSSKSHNINPFERSQYYQYLSSRQALADIASFIEYQNVKYLPGETKWVLFGGSYPGVLSAWARYTFPHLIHAALSSSAPLEQIVDFSRYKDAVAFELSYEKIGGSNACLEIIRQGHEHLVELLSLSNNDVTLQQQNREYIANLFCIEDGPNSLLVQRNLELFMGDGVIDIPFQDNDPSCTKALCNIGKICKAIVNNSLSGLQPVENLAHIRKHQRETEVMDISWERYLDRYYLGNNTDPNDIAWTWQVCTEFGFFQTCESGSACPFARDYHPLSQDIILCKLLFEISPDEVQQNVEEILNWFGGWNIKGTRILFVNGDVDPWSQQAVTLNHGTKSTSWQPTILVKGASHHTWTHPVNKADTIEVNVTREIIYQTVTDWMLMEEEGSDFIGSNDIVSFSHLKVN